MNEKVIKFASVNEHWPMPKPARNHIPDWYKDAEKYHTTGKLEIDQTGRVNRGLKLCAPFLESLTNGYIVSTFQDIQVTQRNNLSVSWRTQPPPMNVLEPEVAPTLFVPSGHDSKLFIWWAHTLIQTPKGYSSLITHPFNRFDLPFTTLSGIVETDGVWDPGAAIPFFFKNDFEGVIPAGTPMYQVLPYKRDNWISEESEELVKESSEESVLAKRVAVGRYKNTWWKKKTFN